MASRNNVGSLVFKVARFQFSSRRSMTGPERPLQKWNGKLFDHTQIIKRNVAIFRINQTAPRVDGDTFGGCCHHAEGGGSRRGGREHYSPSCLPTSVQHGDTVEHSSYLLDHAARHEAAAHDGPASGPTSAAAAGGATPASRPCCATAASAFAFASTSTFN